MGLPMALTLVGGLFSAASSVMAGQAQARAYEAEARMAEYNAKLAERQGVEALKAGAREEERFRQQARQFQSSQRTAMAASGAQVSGSALNVLADTAAGIEQDADTIRFNTLKDKWGVDVQRTNFLNQASVARTSAKNAKTAGWIGGFTSILGTGAQAVSGIPVGQRTGLGFRPRIAANVAASKRVRWVAR